MSSALSSYCCQQHTYLYRLTLFSYCCRQLIITELKLSSCCCQRHVYTGPTPSSYCCFQHISTVYLSLLPTTCLHRAYSFLLLLLSTYQHRLPLTAANDIFTQGLLCPLSCFQHISTGITLSSHSGQNMSRQGSLHPLTAANNISKLKRTHCVILLLPTEYLYVGLTLSFVLLLTEKLNRAQTVL